MAFGTRGFAGLGRETTWGTSLAAVTDYFEALSESVAADIQRFDTRNIVGGIQEPDDSAGVKTIEGDVVLSAHPDSIGHFLTGVMGTNSVTAVLSGFLFDNDMIQTTSDFGSLSAMPSFTLEINRDISSSHVYYGAQFSSIEMNVAPNQALNATVRVIAKDEDMIAKTVPTFPGSPVEPFTFDTTSISIGGIGRVDVEALTVTIDNQLAGVPGLNNTTLVQQIQRDGPQLISIRGVIAFNDTTDYDSFISQAEQAMTVHWTKANSFALLIDIPRFIFTSFPVQMPGRDRITVDFEGKARYLASSATAILVRLTTTNTYSVA